MMRMIHPGKKAILNIGSGDGLSVLDYPFFDGTVCCALRANNKLYILTCSHILTKGNYANYDGYLQQPFPAVEQPVPTPLGTWAYALLNEEFDIALVEPSPEQVARLAPASGFNQARIVDNDDVVQRTAVTMLGYKSGTQRGEVVQTGAKSNFTYGSQELELTNLITVGNPVSATVYQPISQPGDSGAIIYDDNGYALGMVMGCDEHFTYAIPMQNILEQLNMTIY